MRSVFSRSHPLRTSSPLGWAVILALLVFLLVPADLGLKTRLLSSWTVGVGYVLLHWLGLMRTANAAQTRDRSQRHPTSSALIFGLVATVGIISLFAVGFLLSTAQQMPPLIQVLHVGLSALSLLATWCLTHTTFAQQYAALYYCPTADDDEHPWAGGLAFQKEELPNYWDFLYFAFVIGATAQTSDTFILSRPIRRVALVQGLVAFLFFVGILATCVNVGSTLLQPGQGQSPN